VNCDAIARWYRWLEYAGFGSELERRRFQFLSEVADARRVLALGEGDGRFLARLAAQNPQAAIDYIDVSARMLTLAHARVGSGRVDFRQDDVRVAPLPESEYDLIVTHFLLDCFEEPDVRVVAAHIAEAAQPHARWLVSEFRQPSSGWRAVWARLWLRLLYWFFRVTTGLETRRLVDYHPILESLGFRLQREQTSRFGLLTSELWQRS
jgi:ubiquinone/menaquinone biosynthesis C-methylase UbiE